MKKRFDRETIIKLIIILAFLLLVFFILSLFIKNVTIEVVIFGLFFLFLAFNFQSDKSKGSSVFIKSDDKKVTSNKSVNDIKEIKKEPVKEIYKDTKTKSNPKKENVIKKEPEKKKEEVKTPIIIKKEEPKKEKKVEIKKEDKKQVYIPAKVKEKEVSIKEPVKLVLKEKPKENLKLETKKSDEKINVKNLKVANKEKLKSNVNISKGKEKEKAKEQKNNIILGSALGNIVSNRKEKLTPSENLVCAELSLFLFEKNSGLSRIPFRKTKDGLITIDNTNIKFKVEQNEKYMLVPKDKIKDPKLKEKADKNDLVKISLDNGFEVLDEYLASESKKIREKKTDKISFLSFFPFTRKLSERIIKKRQEKAKRVEYLRLYKLYSEIADMYHKSGDYDKEISFLSKAIERFQSKGYSTLLLERKLYNARLIAKEKELNNEKVKRKIKEKKD